MFGEQAATRKIIGDIDVVYHDGLYHLFHLVLPNHDFIAHAVSDNGINWRRIRNALFIGDPGDWDDLMLWTMHISPDPHLQGGWRMFYTGLSRRDQGAFSGSAWPPAKICMCGERRRSIGRIAAAGSIRRLSGRRDNGPSEAAAIWPTPRSTSRVSFPCSPIRAFTSRRPIAGGSGSACAIHFTFATAGAAGC